LFSYLRQVVKVPDNNSIKNGKIYIIKPIGSDHMERKESIKISGMSCAACAARIEKGLAKKDGVKQAKCQLCHRKSHG
jgi:hypothetical protein